MFHRRAKRICHLHSNKKGPHGRGTNITQKLLWAPLSNARLIEEIAIKSGFSDSDGDDSFSLDLELCQYLTQMEGTIQQG